MKMKVIVNFFWFLNRLWYFRGVPRATSIQKKERLDICENCPNINRTGWLMKLKGSTCGVCGCFLQYKANYVFEKCPTGAPGQIGPTGPMRPQGIPGAALVAPFDVNQLLAALIQVGVLVYNRDSRQIALNPNLVSDDTRLEGDFELDQYPLEIRSNIPAERI